MFDASVRFLPLASVIVALWAGVSCAPPQRHQHPVVEAGPTDAAEGTEGGGPEPDSAVVPSDAPPSPHDAAPALPPPPVDAPPAADVAPDRGPPPPPAPADAGTPGVVSVSVR